MYGRICQVIILKAGGVPKDEQWYVGQVLDAVRLPLSSIDGANITVRNVGGSNLDQAYAVGLVSGLGIAVDRCSLTPFSDADGGRGMVVKVYE